MKDESRSKHLEFWALKCREDMKVCQKELTPFINSILENSDAFYKKLAKTPAGLEKIRRLKAIS